MGGFLAWYRPAGGVFVDGRLEAFPEHLLRTYFGVMDDPRAWPGLDATFGFDYAFLLHLWPNRLPLAAALARGRGWQLVYYDAITSIFVPAGDAHREVRERAQRVFAERAARPLDGGSALSPLVVPVADVARMRALGSFVAALGDRPKAIQAFQRTLALDPDANDARYALGVAYWETGDRAAALREWQEVVRRERSGPLAEHAQRAIAQTRGG
jgi:tetratricopeptide (TPR) repeat protein